MEGAPCTKSTNKRMAVFVFPCTGGEGAATLGFLSHPPHLTQGRGQAQTLAELHIYVEGVCNWNNKIFGLCLSPPTLALPSVWEEWEMQDSCSFSPRLYFHGYFKPALATNGSCLGASLPPATSFHPTALVQSHRSALENAAGLQPTNDYKKEAFFKPSPVPHSSSLSCTGSDPHVLLLAVMLACADWCSWPSGPGQGMTWRWWWWPCWPQGIPASLCGWLERRAAGAAAVIN